MKGRRKIEMKLVENKEARLVAFSKRKSGLFTKANELSSLCGIQVGILGFSQSGKPFSFGCPNIDFVIDKFLHNGQESSGKGQGEPTKNGKIDELSKQLEELTKQLQDEKKKGEKLDINVLNEITIDDADLDLEKLQKLKASLEKLHCDFELKLFLIDLEAAKALLLLAEKPIYI